jgi:hypothetical protein
MVRLLEDEVDQGGLQLDFNVSTLHLHPRSITIELITLAFMATHIWICPIPVLVLPDDLMFEMEFEASYGLATATNIFLLTDNALTQRTCMEEGRCHEEPIKSEARHMTSSRLQVILWVWHRPILETF